MKKAQAGLLMAVVFLCHLAHAQTTGSEFQYKTDYAVIKEVGGDLYESLKASFRVQLSAHPIWFKDEPFPYARPFQFESENVPTRIVYISEGFVRLANS